MVPRRPALPWNDAASTHDAAGTSASGYATADYATTATRNATTTTTIGPAAASIACYDPTTTAINDVATASSFEHESASAEPDDAAATLHATAELLAAATSNHTTTAPNGQWQLGAAANAVSPVHSTQCTAVVVTVQCC